MKRAIWILWPSFLVAAAANALLFSVLDPAELHVYWSPQPPSSLAAYTVGFFGLWGVGACACALTCFLQRGPDEVNRP